MVKKNKLWQKVKDFFSFKTLVAEDFVKVLCAFGYGIIAFAVTFFGILHIAIGDYWKAMGGVLTGIILALALRILCESFLIPFKINDSIKQKRK